MCGLAGLFNLDNKNFVLDQNLLNLMQEKIAHRGPDGVGFYLSNEHGLGLAHRRLSIIDLSNLANQPMFSKDRDIVICFNGEIYNYKNIKLELENLGYNFVSNSDTECLIYAYKHWGINFIEKIEGMFAIVLYDFIKRELYLIRDRIGVKPLYFTLQDNILSFASEIKAFWVLPWVKKNINKKAYSNYLTFMVTPAPYTIFDKIYKLPAGYYLKIDSNKNISFEEYYNPIKKLNSQEILSINNENYCLEKIEYLLKESVKKRMVSDVPVAAFLSGGVDSSLNVALMSECSSKIKTFTVGFSDGPELDEFKWARLVSKIYGTEHHEIVISEKEAFDFYEQMVYHLDEPLADCVCIPFYYVAKLARDNGIKVAQVGEGADELFFGYSTYANYKNFYNKFLYSQKIFPNFIKKNIFKFFKNKNIINLSKRDILKNWAYNRELFWSGAIAFTQFEKELICDLKEEDLGQDFIVNKILGQDFGYDSFSIVNYYINKLKKYDSNPDFLKKIFYLELKQRLPELLLMRADKMSMATGVEAREPFLDHILIEFMLNVPENLKFKNNTTKYLLKKIAEKYLPKEIIYRKKMGFAAPTVRWYEHGKFFPNYFNSLINKKTVDVNLKKLYKNNNYNFAVQKWVLQNYYTLEKLM